MTIEVTQEDRERADWWLMQMDGPDYERLCLDFAIHRQAAYAKGEIAGIKLRDDYYNKVRDRNAKGGGS